MVSTDYNAIVNSMKESLGEDSGLAYVCVHVGEEDKEEVLEIIENNGGVVSNVGEEDGFYVITFS